MNLKIQQTTDAKPLAKLNKEVQSLHHQWYPEEFKPFDQVAIEHAFEKMLSAPTTYAFLATKDDQPIGYMLCYIKQRPNSAFQYAKTSLNIDQVLVLSSHRGKGVGERLLQQAISLAKAHDISDFELDHWEQNTMARAFFVKQGFTDSNHRMKRVV